MFVDQPTQAVAKYTKLFQERIGKRWSPILRSSDKMENARRRILISIHIWLHHKICHWNHSASAVRKPSPSFPTGSVVVYVAGRYPCSNYYFLLINQNPGFCINLSILSGEMFVYVYLSCVLWWSCFSFSRANVRLWSELNKYRSEFILSSALKAVEYVWLK